MRLEKREITLNEADSLKDIYYLEKAIFTAYANREAFLVRREVENELGQLSKQSEEEEKRLYRLWENSKKEQEQYT